MKPKDLLHTDAHTAPALTGAGAASPRRAAAAWRTKAFWLKQARIWHWMTGAATLIGMLLFAVTGITLNHAGQIEARPSVVSHEGVLPQPLVESLADQPTSGETMGLPADVARWLSQEMGASVRGRRAEWSSLDVYVGMPKPGGDAWLSIDRASGEVIFEDTSRGAIAYLNDLHKGRNTGVAWSWFIDIFSVAAVLFCLTGLWLLQIHAPKRPITWPLVGVGVAIPLVLILVFVHA